MPIKYTPREKEYALEILESFAGDISLTHQATGIPKRTLRDWRGKVKEDGGYFIHEVDKDTFLPEYKLLRHRLMNQIQQVAQHLSPDSDKLHLQSLAISRLLKHIYALDEIIPNRLQDDQEKKWLIEYIYPDRTIHDYEPWKMEMIVEENLEEAITILYHAVQDGHDVKHVLDYLELKRTVRFNEIEKYQKDHPDRHFPQQYGPKAPTRMDPGFKSYYRNFKADLKPKSKTEETNPDTIPLYEEDSFSANLTPEEKLADQEIMNQIEQANQFWDENGYPEGWEDILDE